jgi:hypothetical protein
VVVPPDRDADRPVVALGQAHRERQLAGHAVRRHDQRRSILDWFPTRAGLGLNADGVAVLVQHRAGDVHIGPQDRAGFDRTPGQHVVEVEAGTHQTVVRKAGQVGPVQLEAYPAADHPEALVLQPAGLLRGVHTHPDQLPGGPRREPVTADLLARELGLLQKQDPESVPGHVIGRRGTARARADHDHVGFVGDGSRRCYVVGHGLTSVSCRLVKQFTSQPSRSLGRPSKRLWVREP